MERQEKVYDLGERTARFAERVRDFCVKLPKNIANNEYVPQLLRASSSPGANYIEANESLGDKDFNVKIKTCRRESKESAYWLRLVVTDDSKAMEKERLDLKQEAIELVLIFNSILKKKKQMHLNSSYLECLPKVARLGSLNFNIISLVLASWFLVLTLNEQATSAIYHFQHKT